MERINIAKTARTPQIDFDFASNEFVIAGESYPEDASTFFGPLLERITKYLSGLSGAEISFRFEMIYFNSSTAKIVMELFEALEEAAASGNQVTITWVYEAGDDNIKELGEEFAEELSDAKFMLEEIAV
jgi:SiaC family regulatory phosphoprotein